MNGLRSWFLQRAIERSLRKKAPERIRPQKGTDCYVAILKGGTETDAVLIEGTDGKILVGKKWSKDRFEEPVKLERDTISNCELEVTHFYHHFQIKYDGLWDFWKGEISFFPTRQHLRNLLSQFRFNTSTRFRHDRIEVLKKLVELKVQEKSDSLGNILGEKRAMSVTGAMEAIYGTRVFAHPSFDEEKARLALVLGSLEASGDLEKSDLMQYSVNPAALKTIAEYELQERRHFDSIKLNKRLVALTWVLALAAVMQVAIPFLFKE